MASPEPAYNEVGGRNWRIVLISLIALQAGLFCIPALEIIRGTPDGYPNEHLRSLLGAMSGMLVCSALMAKNRLQWGLISVAVIVAITQFWVGGYLTR